MHDVRGAIVTANASVTSSAAAITTLIAGDSDYFLDIIEATFSNNSTVAAGVDLGNDGTVIRHIDIAAGGTVQLSFNSPLKQGVKALPWTLTMSGTDITGTTISVGAALIKKLN